MTTSSARQHVAALPVLLVAALTTLGLVLLGQWHGFHRDELYFIVAGQHPALGYPDQPPLTPLLSAGAVALLGLEPFAVRILPALSVGISVVLVGLIARDMGGGRRAQILAGIVLALSGFLAAGHLGSTATYELLLWSVVLWLVVRILDGADARLWLAVGLVAGVALQNKQTALMLGAGLAGGLLIARRWDLVRSPWLWLGGLVAVLVWLPNLAWQAANGFPQLEMAGNIAQEATENRVMLVPELLLLAGPLLFPVALAGIWQLARAPAMRSWRALPAAFVLVLLLVLMTGGKSYYAAGMFAPFMAAGAISLDRWLDRGRERLRAGVLTAAAAVSGLLIAVLTLPVIPPPTLAQTPIPDIYAESAEQVGWPELVATVREATATLSPAQRDTAIVLTANYGEAAAISLLGDDLPPGYSGHNGFGLWGPPPAESDPTILVGHWNVAAVQPALGTCRAAGRIDNGIDLANEEQGAGVWICDGRPDTWANTWPTFKHLN